MGIKRVSGPLLCLVYVLLFCLGMLLLLFFFFGGVNISPPLRDGCLPCRLVAANAEYVYRSYPKLGGTD